MAILCKENLFNSSKKCRFLCSTFKDVVSNCHVCNRKRLSPPSQDSEEETPISDFDDVQEVIVSVMRSRALEAKFRRKNTIMMTDKFSSVVHPISGELFIRTPRQNENSKDDEETDDFASVQSHFSQCSGVAADSEAYFSVKTNFSCCFGLKDIELSEDNRWNSEALDSSEQRRRAIIQEVCHYEGWPFGLCRKVLLLPPLPKSPCDSWTWCKGTAKIVKTN